MVLLILASIGLAWWSYKDIRRISPLYRYLLTSLRALVFILLLIVLANPLFQASQTRREKPRIMVLLDQSRSTSIQKGDYKGTESYRTVLDRLALSDTSRISYRIYAFGHSARPASIDTLQFEAPQTNIYNALETLRSSRVHYQAAIVVSDGIFTQGRDPSFLAGRLRHPLYTIGLGDTTRVRDLVLKEVEHSDTGYLHTQQPVTVTVLNQGYPDEKIAVELQRGEDLVDSKEIEARNGASAQRVTFNIPLDEEGLQQYEVSIPTHEGEWNEANNRQTFSINVLDNRQRILHLAYEVHPDVRAVRSVLASDRNIQFSSRTWISGNRYIGGPIPSSADTLDLLVLQGFPNPKIPAAERNRIIKLAQKVPVLFLSSPDFSPSSLSQQAPGLMPASYPSGTQKLKVTPRPVETEMDHPVMELPQVDSSRLPPLSAPIRNVTTAAGADVLFEASYRGTETQQPLVVLTQVGNYRRAQINGYGLYRYHLSPNPNIRKFSDRLIFNLAAWTATRPDTRKLRIEPTQNNFNSSDAVRFNAFLQNESGQPESDAVINVRISGGSIEERVYTMEAESGGHYRLQVGRLPEGLYTFEAKASKGNREIDTGKGEFSVSASNIELVNTSRNDALLKRLAAVSGGDYVPWNKAGALTDSLRSNGVLEAHKVVSSRSIYLYRHVGWFILALLLLAAEWLIRKRAALP